MVTARDSRVSRTLLLMLTVFLLCQYTYGKIIYVDDDATGANKGTSWEKAYVCLQDALADANGSGKPVEIRVAQGIYKPDRGTSQKPDNREATFQLINGVTLIGGYAGVGKPDPNSRDVQTHKTILSGDLDGNDVNVSDARDLQSEPSCSENSYHVLTSSGTDQTSVLEGFIITGGNADHQRSGERSSHTSRRLGRGGGLYNDAGSPTLINCIFTRNSAESGGGMFNWSKSAPILTNCIFIENSAFWGGGMVNYYTCSPILTNCTFSRNTAWTSGGGMYNWNRSNPTLTGCTFRWNSAGLKGGGIYNRWYSSPKINDCTFSANSAHNGGGMANDDNSNSFLTYCIFSGNSAATGGGVDTGGSSPILANCTFSQNTAKYSAGAGIHANGKVSIASSIFWNNTAIEIFGNAAISYSDIEGGWPGAGNISVDPLFADPGKWVHRYNPDVIVEPDDPDAIWVDGDYHLKSQAGRWDPNSQSWVKDDLTSPCIDAGDINRPAGDEPMSNGGIVNIGAYGSTAYASMSPKASIRISVPRHASNPRPGNRKNVFSESIKLVWTGGLKAVSHDIYFGPNNPPPFICNQTAMEFDLGKLEMDKTYYWRIDEIDSEEGKMTGPVWKFTIPEMVKGRACFTCETLVWAGGTRVPISKTVSGQTVDGIDGFGRVEGLEEHKGIFTCYEILLESGNCISVAENHYFMAESGQWLSLENLKAGIRLKTAKGSIGIAGITPRAEPFIGRVFNLRVEGSDRYLVGEDAIIVRDY